MSHEDDEPYLFPKAELERWRRVPGTNCKISDQGRFYRQGIQKIIRRKTRYIQIGLTIDGKKQWPYIHALVLMAFAGPRPPGFECRHLNGNPHDNHLENLEWGTHTKNEQDKITHDRVLRGERHWKAKLTQEDIEAIRRTTGPRGLGNQLAEKYGVSNQHISKIRLGKLWRSNT